MKLSFPRLDARYVRRILGASALAGAALTLSACVSDASASGPQNVALGVSATLVPTVAAPQAPTAVPTLAPIDVHKPAAIVAGTPISGAAYKEAAQRQYTSDLSSQGASASEQASRTKALTNLIDGAVIALYATQHKITASKAEVDAQLNALKAQYPTAAAFQTALKSNNFTEASLRAAIAHNVAARKVVNFIAPLPKTVFAFDARHILVATPKLANTLYADLRLHPDRFAALAKKYSTDTGSGAQGGELGYAVKGSYVAPFEHAVLTQPIGQVGKPVRSQFGYHIIVVEARGKIALAKLPTTLQQPYQQKQQTVFTAWLMKQSKLDHVRVLAPGVRI